MNSFNLIQNLILSGALGFLSLAWLQNSGVYTFQMSKTDATYHRIIFGVIDYIIYFLLVISFQFAGMNNSIITIASIILTAIANYIYLFFYKLYCEHHMQNGNGFNRLSAKEQAFAQMADKYTWIDIYSFDGTYVNSGYLSNFNVAEGIPSDVTLQLSTNDSYSLKQENDVYSRKTDGNGTKLYLDVENRLKYYITPVNVSD